MLTAVPRLSGAAVRGDAMYVGSLELDVLLGDVHSLKEKRAVVKPIVAELRRRFTVAAAEVGDPDLHTAVQVQVAHLGGGHGEAAPQLGHDRLHHGPLLLQRVHVTQQQVGGQ